MNVENGYCRMATAWNFRKPGGCGQTQMSTFAVIGKTIKVVVISLFLFAALFAIFFMNYANHHEEVMEQFAKLRRDLRSELSNYPNWFKPPIPNLEWGDISSRKFMLSWDPTSEGLSEFTTVQIWRSEHAQQKYMLLATVPRRDGKFIDFATQPNHSYGYLVKVCNILRCSDAGGTEVRTEPTRPNPPGELQAVALSPIEVELRWKGNSNSEEGFKIERQSNSKGVCGPPTIRIMVNGIELPSKTTTSNAVVEVARTRANETVYNDRKVTPGLNYTYFVSAFNENLISQNNPTATVTVPDLERVGQVREIQGIEEWKSDFKLVPAGKQWALVGEESVPPAEGEKKEDLQVNSEIFFKY